MAGLFSQVFKNALPKPQARGLIDVPPLEGVVTGGPIAPRPSPVGGYNSPIDGEFSEIIDVPVTPTQFSNKAPLAGAAALGAVGIAGMGGDGEEPNTVVAEEAYSRVVDPTQPTTPEDLVLITDAQKENAGAGDTEVERNENIDKGVWDSLNEQFDLTTIGLSLLATSANGQPLAANLGLALEAGKLAKDREADEAKKEKRQLTKDELEERKVQADELRARAAMVKATMDADRATAAAQGVKVSDPNNTDIQEVATLAAVLNDDQNILKVKGKGARPVDTAVATKIATDIKIAQAIAKKEGRVLSQSEKINLVNQGLTGMVGESFLFSTPKLDTDVARQSVLQGQSSNAALNRINELRTKAAQ